MSNPTYTGTPLWLTPPPWGTTNTTSGFLAGMPVNGVPGPFKYGAISWWVAALVPGGGSNVLSTIAAWSGTSTNSWPVVISTFSGLQIQNSMNQYWDGTSSNVWFAWQGSSTSANHPLQIANFDLNAGTFGALNTSGTTINNGNPPVIYNLANGSISMSWFITGGTATRGIWTTTYTGGTWAAATRLVTFNTTNTSWVTTTPIANNKLGFILASPDLFGIAGTGPSTLTYFTWDGTATANTITTTLPSANVIFSFGPWVGAYDSNLDMAIFSLPETKKAADGYLLNQSIFTVTPSQTGTSIVRTVIDSDPFLASSGTSYSYGWQQVYFAKSPNNTKFYQLVDYTFPETGQPILYIYGATAATGPWTAQSTFYNMSSHPASPIGYPFGGTSTHTGTATVTTALIYNFAAVVGTDTKLYVTMEFAGEDTNSGRVSMVSAGPSSAPTLVGACPTTNTLQIGTPFVGTLIAGNGNGTYAFTVLS